MDAYKVFYVVVKSGSISAAADSLFISQPAVSQTIKHLEEGLGVNLFYRTPKGVRLTAEGETLFQHISQAYEIILSAESIFQNIQDLEGGEIRIGASDMTLQFYLLPYLEKFHKMYPKVKISVTNGPTPETMKALRAGLIDFGVVSSPAYSDKWMNVEEVGTLQDCFVASSVFKQLRDRVVPLEELTHYPLIMLEKNTSTRRFADQFFADQGVTFYPEFELGTSELIVQFAKRSMGIGYVVEDFAKKDLRDGALFRIQTDKEPPQRKYCLITPAKIPVPAAGKALLNLLHKKDY